jgi:hypothetical protein
MNETPHQVRLKYITLISFFTALSKPLALGLLPTYKLKLGEAFQVHIAAGGVLGFQSRSILPQCHILKHHAHRHILVGCEYVPKVLGKCLCKMVM